jgi:hypothetical protein
MTRPAPIDNPANAVAATAIHPPVISGGIGSLWRFLKAGLFEDSVAVDADPEVLRTAVVPLDQDLELVGVEDGSGETDAEVGPKKLDSVALARNPARLTFLYRIPHA